MHFVRHERKGARFNRSCTSRSVQKADASEGYDEPYKLYSKERLGQLHVVPVATVLGGITSFNYYSIRRHAGTRRLPSARWRLEDARTWRDVYPPRPAEERWGSGVARRWFSGRKTEKSRVQGHLNGNGARGRISRRSGQVPRARKGRGRGQQARRRSCSRFLGPLQLSAAGPSHATRMHLPTYLPPTHLTYLTPPALCE